MIETIATILLGTVSGLISGFLPGLGNTSVLIAAMPWLINAPPELCILFYVSVIQSAQFSGSVAALNFGLMGELTSYPALQEKSTLSKFGLTLDALKFTAIGSVISCLLPAAVFGSVISWVAQQPILLRTDILFGFVSLMLLVLLRYRPNRILTNFSLLTAGILLSQIGLESQGSAEREFLTLGQTWLYAGIPMISVLAGFIVIPMMINQLNDIGPLPIREQIDCCNRTTVKFPLSSSLRGCVVGFLAGLIPILGTILSSNFAWWLEKKFYNKDEPNHAMKRLCAAESANNSAVISVLIPLLILGVGIVPSEMLLVSVLENKFWTPNQNPWIWADFQFVAWLMMSLLSVSVVSYVVCYALIKKITPWLSENLRSIAWAATIITAAGVIYSGSLVEAKIFFVSTFLVFGAIACLFRAVNFMPLVVAFFLGDPLVNNFLVLLDFYK